jgi:DNA-binding transcriptional ArsR family regulator
MSALDVILVSKTRADIFRLLFGLSSKPRYLREIERLAGVTVRILQQELKSLAAAGLVVCRKDGNRTYYEPNKSHPLYSDLRNIVLKTSGLGDVLHEVLQSDAIQWAFIFGSVARGGEGAESDIDLMVIGSLGLRKLSGLLSGVSEKIGREINPHVFLIEEFLKKVQEEDHFVSSVLDSPLLFIVGDENEFRAMVQ